MHWELSSVPLKAQHSGKFPPVHAVELQGFSTSVEPLLLLYAFQGTGMYHIDAKHDQLRKFRRLSGADKLVLEQRARVLTAAWDQQWRRRAILDQHSDELLRHLPNFEAKKAYAVRETNEARRTVAALRDILLRGLKAPPFKMTMLYDDRIFPEPRPIAPVDQEFPPEPILSDPAFNCVEGVVAKLWSLLPGAKRRREKAAQSRYDLARRKWQEAKVEIPYLNAMARAMFETGLEEWWARAQAYQKQQQEENAPIDEFRLRYARGEPDAVIEYFDSVLSNSEYPDLFPTQWKMDFVAETSALIVDYELPSLDKFPTLKALNYDLVRDVFEQSYWLDSEVAQFYDGAIYQTCLRTLHELFAADEADVIASATFNGWVNFTDKANGKPARACIMSVQTTKSTIKQVNLGSIDPQTFFRTLEGVAGAKLAHMSAVVPILRLKRIDDWLIPSNGVVGTARKQPI